MTKVCVTGRQFGPKAFVKSGLYKIDRMAEDASVKVFVLTVCLFLVYAHSE